MMKNTIFLSKDIKMRSLLWIFTFLLIYSNLSAGVRDHLKKITFKPAYHQMRNVDFIYLINLDERPEKFSSCTQQLHPYGIYPYRFSAINGWKLSAQEINDLGVSFTEKMPANFMATYFPYDETAPIHEAMTFGKQKYFCHLMTKGAIGIILSHLSILQDALDSGYETIWVMEDDIEIIQSPYTLSLLIDKLDNRVGKNGWDILFTDRDTKNSEGDYVQCLAYPTRPNISFLDLKRFDLRKPINAEFRKIGSRYGTYSMIIRRTGMQKILNFFENFHLFNPYDIDFFLPTTINLYTVLKDVISTQPKAISDNNQPGYLSKCILKKPPKVTPPSIHF